MVWLYLCKACEEDRHGECDLCTPAPPGHFGGSLCRCPCRGNPKWNTPEYHEDELKKIVQSMLDHQKAVEEAKAKGLLDNLEVNCPPKKIELQKPPEKA